MSSRDWHREEVVSASMFAAASLSPAIYFEEDSQLHREGRRTDYILVLHPFHLVTETKH